MTLTNQNSTVLINPASQAGLYNWTVDGNNIMYQQWFWMRTGSQTQESPVDSSDLTLLAEFASGGHGALVYAGQGYSVTIRFSLLGGAAGSKASDLSEVISIKNTGSTTLPVDFFQYANMQFSKGSDTVQFLTPIRYNKAAGAFI